MGDKIFFLDNKLTLIFKNLLPHNPSFDRLFSFFSIQGINIFIWLIILIIVIIFKERKNPVISKRDKKFFISFLLSFLLSVFLVNIVIKNLIRRSRPVFTNFNQFQQIATNSCPSDFSFPSGHAAASFAAARVLAAFDKKRKWFYYPIAILISYSRVYLGCHFFLDVLTGAGIGYFISKLILSYQK